MTRCATGGAVNDQAWGVVIGAAAVVILRVVDWFLPRGWVSIWTITHGRKNDDDDDNDTNHNGGTA